MNSLFLAETNDTPEIRFDLASSNFSITGVSVPENPIDFYIPITEWLSSYMDTPNKITHFDFKLKYCNTASSKQLVKILFILECIARENTVTVNWHYKKDDTSMLAMGEGYAKIFKLQITTVEV